MREQAGEAVALHEEAQEAAALDAGGHRRRGQRGRDGLDQVLVPARARSLDARVQLALGGEDDDGQGRVPLVLAQRPRTRS